MKVSGEEKIAINSLETISKQYKIDYIISDSITKKISDKVNNLNADALIGIGVWRSILPDDFISSTRLGALCLHGSPLPLYRGFAGINWLIINFLRCSDKRSLVILRLRLHYIVLIIYEYFAYWNSMRYARGNRFYY